MRKMLIFTLMALLLSSGHASRLSAYIKKMEDKDKAEKQQEWQQDMNFGDFSFRLEKRYINEQGERCRDYEFRGRSNPFRHGFYTVCDER